MPLPSTGTAGRWAAAWRALLFRLCPSDPMTVFMAVAMLATVALVASYLPPGAPLTLIRLPRYVMNELRKI